MLHTISLRPATPSEDFTIDHMIEWANGRGFVITDDRAALGEATFTTAGHNAMIDFSVELAAYNLAKGLGSPTDPIFHDDDETPEERRQRWLDTLDNGGPIG